MFVKHFMLAVIPALMLAGLLFEMSSIFHGQGIVICEGLVRGGSESPIPPDLLSGLSAAAAASGSGSSGGVPDPPAGMRVMKFWVKEGKSGSKLVSNGVWHLQALIGVNKVVVISGGMPGPHAAAAAAAVLAAAAAVVCLVFLLECATKFWVEEGKSGSKLESFGVETFEHIRVWGFQQQQQQQKQLQQVAAAAVLCMIPPPECTCI
jgi:hypothetical protein